MLDNKTILITGGTGFIGAYLMRHLLESGYNNIRALKRKTSSMALVEEFKDRVEWIDCDILDVVGLADAMKGVQQVYHSAALVSFNPADHSKMLKVNVEGTANVVNLALDEGIEKLVHVSSIAALGRQNKETHADEEFKGVNESASSGYAISKQLAEMEVFRGIAEGLNAAIVNPSNVLGSGYWKDRTSTGQFFYLTWKGIPFYAQGGSGFVDVNDVVHFMRLLMESEIKGQRFILNGENLPFKELFTEIAKVLKVRGPFIKVTPFIREASWRIVWVLSKISGKPQIITKETARSSARQYTYDNSKSLKAFPDFRYTPIKQTIELTGEDFREAVNNGFQATVIPFR